MNRFLFSHFYKDWLQLCSHEHVRGKGLPAQVLRVFGSVRSVEAHKEERLQLKWSAGVSYGPLEARTATSKDVYLVSGS